MNRSLLAQVESSQSPPAGSLLVMLLFGGLVAWGIFKCISLAERKTTNKKCVYSLAVSLTPWLLASVLTGLGMVSKASFEQTILLALVIVGTSIAAVALAILGLLEIRRSKRDQRRLEEMVEKFGPSEGEARLESRVYTQGRNQAIFALLLASLFIVPLGLGVVRGARGEAEKAAPQPSERLVFEDLNFTLAAPGGPWKRSTTQAPGITVALADESRQIGFGIAAETGDPGIDSRALAERIVDAMQKNTQNLQQLEAEDHMVGDFAGRRVVLDTTTKGARIAYVIWSFSRRGYLYRLTTWGSPASMDALKKDLDMMIGHFSLIDPGRDAPRAAAPPGNTAAPAAN